MSNSMTEEEKHFVEGVLELLPKDTTPARSQELFVIAQALISAYSDIESLRLRRQAKSTGIKNLMEGARFDADT